MPPAARAGASPSRRKARDLSKPPGLGFSPREPVTPASARKPSPSKALACLPATDGYLPCITYVAAYHVVFIGALVLVHVSAYGKLNITQALLAVFLTINAWICVCEIALLCYPKLIQEQFAAFSLRFGDHVLPTPIFLTERVRVRDVLSLRYWAIMWSTYSTLDIAYSDTHSFGYNIDVGNGVSMLLPTLALSYGMTAQEAFLPARMLGMLGLIAYYQMFYGTVVYFFQYCNNKRYVGTPSWQVYGVVVVSNGIWLAGPALGMWASSRLILDGDFQVFR